MESKPTIRLIIAGGRDFENYDLLKKSVFGFIGEELVNRRHFIEIVSGAARGADKLGERFYSEFKDLDKDLNKRLTLKRFEADWSKYGKSAGPIRNRQMAEYATHCICFWDCESKGTKNMIDLAKEFNLELKIVKY